MRISSVARFPNFSSASPSQLNWKMEEQIAKDFRNETKLVQNLMDKRTERLARERRHEELRARQKQVRANIREERAQLKVFHGEVKELKERLQSLE